MNVCLRARGTSPDWRKLSLSAVTGLARELLSWCSCWTGAGQVLPRIGAEIGSTLPPSLLRSYGGRCALRPRPDRSTVRSSLTHTVVRGKSHPRKVTSHPGVSRHTSTAPGRTPGSESRESNRRPEGHGEKASLYIRPMGWFCARFCAAMGWVGDVSAGMTGE